MSHPADFTPVCTTELAALEQMAEQFEQRGVRLIGLSCDSLAKHERWAGDVVEFAGGARGSAAGGGLSYPIVADDSRDVATLYGMLSPELRDEAGLPLTVRDVFLVSPQPQSKIELLLSYPASTGRYWPEVLRAVDSILNATANDIATPHGWQPGEEVVVKPGYSTAQAKEMYPSVRVVKPYLRFIDDPAKAKK